MINKPKPIEERINPEKNHLKPRPRSWKKIIFGFLIGLFLAFIFWFGISILLAASKIITPNPTGSAPWLLPSIGLNKLKGEGDGRINILLLGIGGGKHPGANLTDTIMLASINPIEKSIVLLSIPRDLYVPIEGAGYNKINYAHAFGEENQKKTGGGPALSKQVVSEILDLPIHYFIRLDFEGFVKLVDQLGGVDIYVEKAIYDPYYPAPDMKGYQPFSIKAGFHHMDGNLALKYVRSRETTSDFDRSKRQQKFLTALLDKALSLGVLTNPKKVSSIIYIAGSHLKTDLQIWEIERLIGLIKEIKPEKIALKVLDNSENGLLMAKTGPEGYYLVPKSGNFKEIQRFVHQFLTDPFLEQEKAKIEIQNASGKVNLATQLVELLKSYGYQVVKVSGADTIFPKTTIYDYTGGKKSATIAFLKKRLKTDIVKTLEKEEGDIDILVILGKDFKMD